MNILETLTFYDAIYILTQSWRDLRLVGFLNMLKKKMTIFLKIHTKVLIDLIDLEVTSN
jgi:hypothetical protein